MEQSFEKDCSICYEIMIEPVTTSCGHNFCYNCLRKAVETKMTCPICRAEIEDIDEENDFSINHSL